MEIGFERWCDGCRRFGDACGMATVALAPGTTLAPAELNLSDLYFGSGNEASPLLLAGEAFVAACREAKLTGIDAYAAHGS